MNEMLTEQEQMRAIKDWWKENGTQILIAVSAVAIAYFGYQWWQNRQASNIQAVSSAYEQYIQTLSDASVSGMPEVEQVRTVNYLTDQLIEEHSNSHYSFLAALNTAAFDVRRGDFEAADQRLAWAYQNADEPADQQLVNYRHALVKAELGQADQALSMLDQSDESFSSIYAEARGDIQLSVGNIDAALSDYESARDTMLADDRGRLALIEVKIASLTTGAAAIVSGSE